MEGQHESLGLTAQVSLHPLRLVSGTPFVVAGLLSLAGWGLRRQK